MCLSSSRTQSQSRFIIAQSKCKVYQVIVTEETECIRARIIACTELLLKSEKKTFRVT